MVVRCTNGWLEQQCSTEAAMVDGSCNGQQKEEWSAGASMVFRCTKLLSAIPHFSPYTTPIINSSCIGSSVRTMQYSKNVLGEINSNISGTIFHLQLSNRIHALASILKHRRYSPNNNKHYMKKKCNI